MNGMCCSAALEEVFRARDRSLSLSTTYLEINSDTSAFCLSVLRKSYHHKMIMTPWYLIPLG